MILILLITFAKITDQFRWPYWLDLIYVIQLEYGMIVLRLVYTASLSEVLKSKQVTGTVWLHSPMRF